MTDTPRLEITQLEEDQALPEVRVNEGTRILEAFANATHFISRTTTAQPGSPADGDTYLLPGSSTGTDWAGHDGEIAIFLNTAWIFRDAKEGFIAWVDDDDELIVFDGSTWDPVSSGGGSSIEVLDEGSTETSTLVSLDFVGAGVTATDDGSGNVEVNIPGGGAGSAAWALAGAGQTATGVYDFAVDGAKANIDFTGLSAANELLIIARGLTAAVSGNRVLRVSVDNGSTFYSTNGDYVSVDNVGVEANVTVFASHGTASTSARTLIAHVKNTKGAAKLCHEYNSGDIFRLFVASASDIDAIRVLNSAGGNITAGTVRVYAR